jgi:hypothetical protein
LEIAKDDGLESVSQIAGLNGKKQLEVGSIPIDSADVTRRNLRIRPQIPWLFDAL